MILHHYLVAHQMLGYAIIFFGMIIEGDILLFTAGFLTHQGYFDIGPVLILVFLGAIIGDSIWYVLGKLISEKELFLKVKKFIEKATSPFDAHLKNRPVRTLFISKFAYGLCKPIILKAGTIKISFEKFIKTDLAATFMWIFLVGGLGYLSSASFLAVRHYLKYTELSLFLGIAIFILISYVVTKISKKEL